MLISFSISEKKLIVNGLNSETRYEGLFANNAYPINSSLKTYK